MRAGRITRSMTGVAALLLCAMPPLGAQQVILTGKATSIAEQKRALAQATAQALTARRLSHQMEAHAKSARAEADRLNARAAALAARIQQSEAELRAGVMRIALINRLIADQRTRLAAKQGPLVRLVAALQSVARRPPVLALLQPGSLVDAVHMRAAFAQILPVIQQRTAALRADLAHARQLKTLAVTAAAAQVRGKESLKQQRLALGKLEAEKRLASRGLASGASLEAERATALGEEARDIGALMHEIETAGDIRARLASLPGPQPRPGMLGQPAPPTQEAPAAATSSSRAGTAPAYRLPVMGIIVTGMGEVGPGGVRARGLTIAVQPGAQVVAPADGRIAFAGPYRGFGQILILDHGGGWASLITDLAHLSARVGQSVEQGAPLGAARPTAGGSGNPTITVELRRQGRPVDIVAMTTTRS